MSNELKEGDPVQVVEREATSEDQKSGLYYNHFRGLYGKIQKIYDNGEVAVEISLPSLPESFIKRHNDVRDQMRTKWLDGLSEEAKSKLTQDELNFKLRYSILLKLADIHKVSETAAAEANAVAVKAAEEAKRLTSKDLTAAEESYLQKRKS